MMRTMMRRWTMAAAALGMLAGVAGPGEAAVVLFSGADPGAQPGGARPISDAAAAAFAAAAGTSTLINFESAPLGSFTSLGVAPGVTATLSGTENNFGNGITNDNSSADLGFNTTPGGSQFVRIVPAATAAAATLTFNFSSGIDAFGAYLTGLETAVAGTLSLRFNDGSDQVVAIAKNATAGVQFFGFTNIGASITTITLSLQGPFTSTRDLFGVDDVRFSSASPSAIPEPSSLALCGIASLAGLGGWARRRRAATA